MTVRTALKSRVGVIAGFLAALALAIPATASA